MESISSALPESKLLIYEVYMHDKCQDEDCGIIHNRFIDSYHQEGYKAYIAGNTRKLTDDVFGPFRNRHPKKAVIFDYIRRIVDMSQNMRLHTYA